MPIFHAIILGIVQGATEYIPVSSSAHLVLVPWILGWEDSSFAFEVLIQWGTLIGVFVYFWQDLWGILRGTIQGLVKLKPFGTMSARLGWYIVLGTLPAVFFGLLLKDFFEAAFGQPVWVAGLLLVTAAMLLAADRWGKGDRGIEKIRWPDGLIVGLWQVAALLPGISRSGATISGGVLHGLYRSTAARFSFLLSVPALLGAGVLALLDLLESGTLAYDLPPVAAGFVAAAISGYLCIRWLMSYLKQHSLTIFAVYCACFGTFCLVVALIRS